MMPKVDLTTPVWDENRILYRPGKGVEVPQALAERLGAGTSSATTSSYPYAELLTAGGFGDWKAVETASDEDLLKVEGIGPARVKEIRAYKG